MRDTNSRRSTDPISPIPSGELPAAVEDFTRLASSLNRVLDASVRDVVTTLSSIDGARNDGRDDLLATLSNDLETMSSNLQEVSELVHVAMQGAAVPIGSSLASVRRPVDIAEAVQHACDVVQGQVRDLTIRFSVELPANVAMLPSGPLYAALLGGLRHAARSIQNAGGQGVVSVTGRLRSIAVATHSFDAVEFTIEDDGSGPVEDEGICGSLSLCHAIVSDAGGGMELARSKGRSPREGCVLKMHIPKPIDWGSVTVGKRSV